MRFGIPCAAILIVSTLVANAQTTAANSGEFLALPPRQAAEARFNYMQHCMGCHLPDGSGAPNKGIPSMRDMLGRFLAVPGGRAFIVQVPGVMNSALQDQDIAGLMNWLLPQVSLNTLPTGTAPYTGAEIAALRANRPVDIPAARQLLVEQMRLTGSASD
jgi:mono/diheme cytochrome c family protein